ncbi:hypothetical protein AMELA_G00087660 [Ameiurus melas]|uniref:Poly [ADP-ribose] polymerase n=1 Tax=Ameiurus melas TaxID=219545 RepID=A0A7J6AV54_AMEME|nr:hypothetical protein AMELA_G00087660 [Ameiurus melas]
MASHTVVQHEYFAQIHSKPVMEDGNALVLLQPQGIEVLKYSRAAFCHAVQGKFGCTTQIHNVEDHAASSFSHSKAPIVPEIKYSKQLSKSLTLSVWKDDLTTHKANAVVNAANEYLSHGAGLALALSHAGGPTIKKCSEDIIKQMGKVPTGQAVQTPAGNLPCKMIIHAVGPCLSTNATNAELMEASDLLGETIWNILRIVDYENLQSVAIPAISSGLFNFPLQKCAEIIVHTVKKFSKKRNPRASYLEVRLVNNDDPSVQQMQRACGEILGSSDQIMPNQGNAPTQSPVSSLNLGNVTLHLKKGAIEDETTDVIVNTIGADLDLSKGQVSAALLRKAGWKIQEELRRTNHGYVFEGAVIPTGGHNLNCKAVYHTVCVPKSFAGNKANKILQAVVTHCLTMVTSKSGSSISFPALGTGNLGLQKDEVAQIMTTAVVEFSKNYTGSKIKIFFVIFPKDTLTLKAFEKAMASTNTRLQTFQSSSSTNGKSSSVHDIPCIELLALSPEAIREAKRWCCYMLHLSSDKCPVKIYNNHIVHLSQEDHVKLMSLQFTFNVIITEFFKEGKGGIIINGDPVGVSCAAFEVEAMLCQVQEDFAWREEEDMQGDLEYMYVADNSGQRQETERMSNGSYQKTSINLDDKTVKERMRNFGKCGLRIVKMEEIENYALKQIFQLKSKRIQSKPRHLYQCVKAQFCDLICRVGFQREYAPPEEQKYGAGIYFTSELDKARSLWADNGEEYIYFIEADVLTGKEKLGSAELIVPPPIGEDPLVRYDSVTSGSGIHIIFNGQQAYPKYLITCSK